MEDFTVNPGTFTCPPDFTENINTEGLCLEDIEDEDSELFLIQTPIDVDLTKLNNQQLFLEGLTEFHSVNKDGLEEVHECVTTDAMDKQVAKGHLVLPRRHSMKLQAAKKQFQRFVFVEQRISICPFGYPRDLPKNVPVPENLKKRFQSFSLVDENTIKTEKCASVDSQREVDSSRSARKKHRHLVQDAKRLENSSAKSKKKHKCDKGDEVVEHIKNEALSGDERNVSLSEVTSRGSSKTKKKKHRSVDPEYVDSQVSDACQENGVTQKTKKKKHRSVDPEYVEPQLMDACQEHDVTQKTKTKKHRKADR